MARQFDSRHEAPSSPEELVSAAEDSLQRFLDSNFPSEHRTHVQFLRTLNIAYKTVMADEVLSSRFEGLLDEIVGRLPNVESGRVSPGDAKAKYRVTSTSELPPVFDHLSAFFGGKINSGRDQDVLWLLKKVVKNESL